MKNENAVVQYNTERNWPLTTKTERNWPLTTI